LGSGVASTAQSALVASRHRLNSSVGTKVGGSRAWAQSSLCSVETLADQRAGYSAVGVDLGVSALATAFLDGEITGPKAHKLCYVGCGCLGLAVKARRTAKGAKQMARHATWPSIRKDALHQLDRSQPVSHHRHRRFERARHGQNTCRERCPIWGLSSFGVGFGIQSSATQGRRRG
jgi:hypothetical protein